MASIVQITHHDWRTDRLAITHPWGVQIDGLPCGQHETANHSTDHRQQSIGAAGDHARAVAAATGGRVDWSATAEIP
jgi:hypothetical protein